MTFSKDLLKRLSIALTDEKSARELESIIAKALVISEPSPESDQAKRLVIDRPAGETISALKLVRIEGGSVFLGSANSESTSSIIGMALNAAAPGEVVAILIYGIHEDQFFQFQPNEVLFLAADGSITEVPPTVGVLTKVGTALGGSQILLNVSTESIKL